jgi:GNAT superfamily N-acetyltransferase
VLHRGDWNVVNEIALRLLADAEAAGVDPDDVRKHVRTAAAGENLDARTLGALDILFTDPISSTVPCRTATLDYLRVLAEYRRLGFGRTLVAAATGAQARGDRANLRVVDRRALAAASPGRGRKSMPWRTRARWTRRTAISSPAAEHWEFSSGPDPRLLSDHVGEFRAAPCTFGPPGYRLRWSMSAMGVENGQRKQQVTDAIAEAAFAEVVETGYARMPMDAVARRAGVGKAALYRRWSSKQVIHLRH